MLPLWANYPEDRLTFAMDDQFMVGDGLLVKPVTTAGASSIEVYFPGNNEVNNRICQNSKNRRNWLNSFKLWYDTKTFRVFVGGSKQTITGLTLATVFLKLAKRPRSIWFDWMNKFDQRFQFFNVVAPSSHTNTDSVDRQLKCSMIRSHSLLLWTKTCVVFRSQLLCSIFEDLFFVDSKHRLVNYILMMV